MGICTESGLPGGRDAGCLGQMNLRWINALLWGNSVALAWMWGLGLFFSVQMTFMFGLQGLLLFAIPNAFAPTGKRPHALPCELAI